MFGKGLVYLYNYKAKYYFLILGAIHFFNVRSLEEVFVSLRDSFNNMWQIILIKQSEIAIVKAGLNIFKKMLTS